MNEVFKVLMQDGYFKIIDEKEREKFKNFCKRYKGLYAEMEISTGISINSEDKNNDRH